MSKQVHFETDLLWVTWFMIQKALEELIELNVKQIPQQLRSTFLDRFIPT